MSLSGLSTCQPTSSNRQKVELAGSTLRSQSEATATHDSHIFCQGDNSSIVTTRKSSSEKIKKKRSAERLVGEGGESKDNRETTDETDGSG